MTRMEVLIVRLDLPLLVLSGVILQMFIIREHRFVRCETVAMIALYALFLSAHFRGFRLDLP